MNKETAHAWSHQVALDNLSPSMASAAAIVGVEMRDPLLVEREKTHGDFAQNALISQMLKSIMHRGDPTKYTDVQAEAIDMICLKLSRIASGQAYHADHWDDIAGYAKLASEEASR